MHDGPVSGLHYGEAGDPAAPVVVLLHGVGTSSWMWGRLVRDLADEVRVVSVDLPGHGDSAGTPWTSMGDAVARVADLVRAVAPAGAHVVGLSLGGYLALDLAAAHPGLLMSATASGVNVLPFPRPGLMRAAGRVMSPLMSSGVMLRANARALGVQPADFDGYAAAARAMAPGTFLTVGSELMDYAVPSAAATSTCRVLAVAGGSEQALILRSLPLIAAAFPRGRAGIAPGVGHAWNAQAPELFGLVVRAQLTDSALPAGLTPVPAA